MESIYYDIHCHLAEFADNEIEQMMTSMPNLKVVAVSDDIRSLNRVLDIASRYQGRVFPCAGFHPWSLKDHPLEEAWQVIRLAERAGVICIGEVGLDRKFMPEETFTTQRKVFEAFAKAARDMNAFLNIHSPGAWRDALNVIVEVGVEDAVFHWYTGPLDLVDEIVKRGYFVSINVAAEVQSKSKDVAKAAPLTNMVLESDGPYNYHGLRLTPLMIPRLVKLVAELKGVTEGELQEAIAVNSERLLKLRT